MKTYLESVHIKLNSNNNYMKSFASSEKRMEGILPFVTRPTVMNPVVLKLHV